MSPVRPDLKTEEEVRQLLNTRESGKRRGALHHYTESGRRPSGQESQDRIEIQQSWSRSQHTGLCLPGFTPLQLCVAAYHSEAILKISKILLRAGVDANKQDRFGSTYLLVATVKQNFAMISL